MEFFTDLYDACEEMDIPADTAIFRGRSWASSKSPDCTVTMPCAPPMMRGCQDAVKGLARRHGWCREALWRNPEDIPDLV